MPAIFAFQLDAQPIGTIIALLDGEFWFSSAEVQGEAFAKEASRMLWTILVILLILWLLGFIGSVGGNLIHLLLVVALVVLIINLVSGRRPVI